MLVPVLLASGCGRRETDVQRATRQDLLLVNNAADPAQIDPQLATGLPEVRVLRALFEGLTRLEPGSLAVRPGVAERWDVSADGLVYTFHLRADARWSDGGAVTADDFVAAVKRMLDPKLGSDLVEQIFYLTGAEDYYRGRRTDFAAVGTRALDPRTLELRLKYPKPFFLQVVSQRSWYPIPRHVIARFDAWTRRDSGWTRPENLVGNGPFVLSEWRPRQFLTVTRSPTYWNRKQVRLAAVRYFAIEKQAADEMAFRSGQLHKTDVLPANKVGVWRHEHPELLRSVPRCGTYFYAFNVTRPPFDDVRVRRAFALTVDRVMLTEHVLGTGEAPADHIVVDGTAGYASRSHLPYDPVEARRLLAAAGYPGGRGFPAVSILYNTTERHRTIAEAVQQMWRSQLGIEVQLRNEEWGVYLSSMDTLDYDIVRRGLMTEPYDPWLQLQSYTTGHGFNRTGWSNAEYDRLIHELEAAADPAERETLAQEAEALLLRELPVVPFHFYLDNYLVDARVRNWNDGLYEVMPVTEAWLEH